MVRRHAAIASGSILLALAFSSSAYAQDPPTEAETPAHISLVEGVAVLERDGSTDNAPANMVLLAGDRIRTRIGRVEILFADGSTLHLDHNSAIDLQSDELVRLLDGRIRLSIPALARDVSYRIDGPHAWAQISQPGEYRAAVIQNAGASELEFAVLRGSAELTNEGGRTTLRAGERAFARADAAPSHPYVFNSASWDPFDRWSEARRSERLGVSTQYLPAEVRSYAGTLDRYGSWEYEASYGYVWYPRVDYGWRPYYHGRWSSLRPYGWTWIGSDPWGWPTHHYGRWGVSTRGSWYWIPGRSWSPAWVSWGHAPGYVSWCPLGFNNRPVFQIGVGGHFGYDPWRAWTVIPQRDFGVGFVHRRVLVGSAIDARTRSAFTYGDRAPIITGHAVSRGSSAAPIRVAGTATARRDTAPLLTNRGTATPNALRSTAPTRVIDMTRRPSSSPGDDRLEVGRERTTPDRPLIRSERVVGSTRPAPPTVEYRSTSRRPTHSQHRILSNSGRVSGGDSAELLPSTSGVSPRSIVRLRGRTRKSIRSTPIHAGSSDASRGPNARRLPVSRSVRRRRALARSEALPRHGPRHHQLRHRHQLRHLPERAHDLEATRHLGAQRSGALEGGETA